MASDKGDIKHNNENVNVDDKYNSEFTALISLNSDKAGKPNDELVNKLAAALATPTPPSIRQFPSNILKENTHIKHPYLNNTVFNADLVNALKNIKRQHSHLTHLSKYDAEKLGLKGLPCNILFVEKEQNFTFQTDANTQKLEKKSQEKEPHIESTYNLEKKSGCDIYAVGEMLGAGGYGFVRIILNLGNFLFFAAKTKLLPADFRTNPKSRTSITDEIDKLSKLGHYRGHLYYNNCIVIIEDYFPGTHLFKGVRDLKKWALSAKASLIAMDGLHQCKIIHRDIKANNIICNMVEEDNNNVTEVTCHVIDVGCSKSAQFFDPLSGASTIQTGWGLDEYRSPDIKKDKEGMVFNRETDLYALGVIFKEALENVKKKTTSDEEKALIEEIRMTIIEPMMSTIVNDMIHRVPETAYFIEKLDKLLLVLDRIKKVNTSSSANVVTIKPKVAHDGADLKNRVENINPEVTDLKVAVESINLEVVDLKNTIDNIKPNGADKKNTIEHSAIDKKISQESQTDKQKRLLALISEGEKIDEIMVIIKEKPEILSQALFQEQTPSQALFQEQTPLFFAIKCEQPHVVAALIEYNKTLLDKVDANSWSPLHYAIIWGSESMVRVIVKIICTTNFSVVDASNPMPYAFKQNALLLEKCNNLSPLELAAQYNNLSLMSILIESNAAFYNAAQTLANIINLNPISPTGAWFLIKRGVKETYIQLMTILYQAIINNEEALVFEILEQRKAILFVERDFDKTTFGADKLTLLHVACQKGNINIVRKLICHPKIEPFISSQDGIGNTPMHYAGISGKPNCVKLLIDKLMDKRALSTLSQKNNEGEDAFTLAYRYALTLAEEGYPISVATQMIFYGQFINASAIMPAMHFYNMFELFMTLDKDYQLKDLINKLNCQDALFSVTEPTSMAILSGFYDPVPEHTPYNKVRHQELFKKMNDNPVYIQKQKHFLIDVLIFKGLHFNSNKTIKVLIEIKMSKKISLDEPNLGGLTLLQQAALLDRSEIVKFLLDKKANPAIRDVLTNKTAFEWALADFSTKVAYEFCYRKLHHSFGKSYAQAIYDVLICAIRDNKLNIVKTLYPYHLRNLPKKSQDPDKSNYSLLDLSIDQAFKTQDESIVRYFLTQDIDVTKSTDYLLNADPKALQEMVGSNMSAYDLVNYGICDIHGALPIHRAIIKGLTYSCIKEIIEKMKLKDPKSINAIGVHGCSPLLLAIIYGRAEIVELLLAHGADPNNILSEEEFNPFEKRFGLFNDLNVILQVTSEENKKKIAKFMPQRINGLVWAIEFSLNAIVYFLVAHQVGVYAGPRILLEAVEVSEKGNYIWFPMLQKLLLSSCMNFSRQLQFSTQMGSRTLNVYNPLTQTVTEVETQTKTESQIETQTQVETQTQNQVEAQIQNQTETYAVVAADNQANNLAPAKLGPVNKVS